MAELAGLIGKREARISRGPFPWDMRGARVRPDLPCSKTLEGPTGASPYLDWTHVVFLLEFRRNRGGRMQSILPFVQTSFMRRERSGTKPSTAQSPPALREDSNLVRRSLVPSASWIRLGAVG